MTTVAGVISVLALAVVVGSLAALHLLPTGLSPVRNAVSQYGITGYRALYRSATIAFGISGLALADGIDRSVRGGGRGVVVALLVVFAAARCAISWFPMDLPGAEATQSGRTHGLFALGAFASATLAAFKLAGALSQQSRWHSLSAVSTALGAVMAACLLSLGLARSFPVVRGYFGAIERGFYLAAISWFAVFSVACIAGTH